MSSGIPALAAAAFARSASDRLSPFGVGRRRLLGALGELGELRIEARIDLRQQILQILQLGVRFGRLHLAGLDLLQQLFEPQAHVGRQHRLERQVGRVHGRGRLARHDGVTRRQPHGHDRRERDQHGRDRPRARGADRRIEIAPLQDRQPLRRAFDVERGPRIGVLLIGKPERAAQLAAEARRQRRATRPSASVAAGARRRQRNHTPRPTRDERQPGPGRRQSASRASARAPPPPAPTAATHGAIRASSRTARLARRRARPSVTRWRTTSRAEESMAMLWNAMPVSSVCKRASTARRTPRPLP